MNNGLYFTAGLILGSVVTFFITKKYSEEKYKQIADEEIESVKERFSSISKKPPKTNIPVEWANEFDKAAEMIIQHGYSNNAPSKRKEEHIRVISPEEFGIFSLYDKQQLNYYSDEILADDNDDIIEDYELIVGPDFADHFGEYEEDTVYIRNDLTHTYYEITRDNRTYEFVSGLGPVDPLTVGPEDG